MTKKNLYSLSLLQQRTICESGGPLRFDGSGDDVVEVEVELEEEEVAFLEV